MEGGEYVNHSYDNLFACMKLMLGMIMICENIKVWDVEAWIIKILGLGSHRGVCRSLDIGGYWA